jgi:LysM repeat protein
MTYNSNMFEAGRGSIYKSPPKSSSNANKQAAGSMGSVGIGGIGGKPTTSAAQKIQDQFRRETQKDDDRRGLGASPKVTPTPQKSYLESLYDRVKSSILFAGGDPNKKKRPDPNPGALYTASPFIIPAATAVTASVLGPGVDYTDPTQVPTGIPSIYTPASRDFGKGTEPIATPEKPETAKIDTSDLLGLKEKVVFRDAPGLMAPPSMDQPAAPVTARSAAMTAGINKVLKDVIAPKSKEYKIKGGDTLSAISRREGVSVDDLVKINGIEDKDKIFAGDSIIIPKPEEVEQAKEFVLRVSTRGDEDPDAQFYNSFTQGITPDDLTGGYSFMKEGSKFTDALKAKEADNYDTIFGNAETKRTPFKGTKVSDKTIAEILDFVKLNGEFHKYNKDKGYNTTAVGKYQIVGDTLRDLDRRGVLKDLGITDNSMFDGTTQDKIAAHQAVNRIKNRATGGEGTIATRSNTRDEMRKEWEGFKKLSDRELDDIIDEIAPEVGVSIFEGKKKDPRVGTSPRPKARPLGRP